MSCVSMIVFLSAVFNQIQGAIHMMSEARIIFGSNKCVELEM